MVFQTEADYEADDGDGQAFNTSGNSIRLHYHAPRRSCRVNVHLVAFSKGKLCYNQTSRTWEKYADM